MKQLPGIALSQLADQHYNRWFVEIDPKKTPIEDVFRPQFWAACQKIGSNDRVRIRAIDGSYDFELTAEVRHVLGKPVTRMVFFPNVPNYVRAAAESAGHEMVPQAMHGRPVPRIDYAEIDGWRVIGFDGEVASKRHATQAEAAMAMANYIAAHGINTVADGPVTDAKSGEVVVTPKKAEAPSVAPGDMNLSYEKRKESVKKAERQAQRDKDMAELEARKQASA